MVIGFLRAALVALGVLAFVDPAAGTSLVAVMVLGVALLVVTVVAAVAHAHQRGLGTHPTRRSELVAPLSQSDPDAAGHVRRRGPGQVAAAA